MRSIPDPRLLLAGLLAAMLAACGGERADVAEPPPRADADVGETQPEPASRPGDAAEHASVPPGAASPAPGSIRFDGFGSADFGANVEAVRIAWGQPLGSVEPQSPQGCYYLFPEPRPQGRYRIAFMIEGGEFRRLDVGAADVLAPGGGRLGMRAEEIERLYPGRIERRPHKYINGGQYLRINDVSGDGVLVFATDAAGTVDEWRVGLPPQVDYVEGCS